MARERRYGLPRDTVVDLALCGVPAAIVGARLYYVIFSWPTYAKNPISALYLWEGGLAIYGGILGGLLAGLLYARKKGLRFLTLADLVAPCFAIGQAVGRWGNFFNQEAYGVAVANPALQRFPIAVCYPAGRAEALRHLLRRRTIWCLTVCAILLLLERRGSFKRPGDAFPHLRAPLRRGARPRGGLRTDSLYWGPVRVSQALSVLRGSGSRYTADRSQEGG